MRTRLFLAVLMILACAVAPVFASMSGGSKPERPEPSSQPEGTALATPRQDAERYYGDAYEEVAKAKKDIADGKTKNVEKKFKKALDRGQRAVDLDSTYYEAWNLVGFCARNLKSYDRSLAAYAHCLSIKPDFAPAREYLGEAYVELGQPEKAREQLAWLERLKATEQVVSLKAQIDAWVAAHPDAHAPAPVPAPSDSTAPHPEAQPDSVAAPSKG